MHHPDLTPPDYVRPDYDDPKYTCDCCKFKFHEDDGGLGDIKISGLYFCGECVKRNEHLDWIKRNVLKEDVSEIVNSLEDI